MIISYFLVFLTFIQGALSLAKSADIGCFVNGECQESISIGVSEESTPESCLNTCKSTANCEFFTHYQDDNICLLLLDCVNLSDSDCTDCISGDVTCEELVCNEPGK